MYNWVLNTILQNKLKEDSVLWKNQTLKKHNFFSRLSVIFKFLANIIYYKFFWWLHFGRRGLILGVHVNKKKKKKKKSENWRFWDLGSNQNSQFLFFTYYWEWLTKMKHCVNFYFYWMIQMLKNWVCYSLALGFINKTNCLNSRTVIPIHYKFLQHTDFSLAK